MNFIGNIAWLLFGGFITALMYWIFGILFCITIIGIPFGVQLIKIGTFAIWPFGKELSFTANGPGCLAIIGNLIWIICGWWEIALTHAFFGLVFCATIVGIPLGIKHFQIAGASIFPFGQKIFSR